MIRIYNPVTLAKAVAYMLQNTEYEPRPYVLWLFRATTAKKIFYRRKLRRTKAAKLFTFYALGAATILYGLGIFLIYYGYKQELPLLYVASFVTLLLLPLLVGLVAVAPVVVGLVLVKKPKEKKLIAASASIFANSKAVKIAVAGSYGKTSMKELLGHILSSEKKVAVTPANKNVAISHAVFAAKLQGDEDVLIVEFGEGKPKDVERFTRTLQPTIAVITGLAPAHLDKYSSMDEVAQDILSVATFMPAKNVYINADSSYAEPYIKNDWQAYSSQSLGDYRIENVHVNIETLSFTLHVSGDTYKIQTNLIGRHSIGPLVAAIRIAMSLGISKQAIIKAIASLKPYEHRMQPRNEKGAWVIDDTYNGNIEGIKAGLAYLREIQAKRKWYVTPGLVDQGVETVRVHNELGKHIAAAQPNIVVLMQHSVTQYIVDGLKAGGFRGELRLEDDPLRFYSNLQEFLAAGDVVLMQNDWPDNYN